MFSFFISCCLMTSLIAQSSHLSITQPNGDLIDQEIEIKVDDLNKLCFSMGESHEADGWNQLVSFFHEVLKPTQEHIMNNNQEKFSALKQLNLPISQYAITGSGPMGIRNLKAIGDIDIIVTEGLWNDLASRYKIIDQNGVKKITFLGGIIEAFHQGSFYSKPYDDKVPTYASRIANAEIIDGLPFDTLEIILYYKQKERREKDLQDIELIEKWMILNKDNSKYDK